MVSGLAIYIAFLLATYLATPHTLEALPLLAVCGLLLLTGMADDMFELTPRSRIIVQIINIFNMMDGIDGLSGMVFIVAASAMARLALGSGQWPARRCAHDCSLVICYTSDGHFTPGASSLA